MSPSTCPKTTDTQDLHELLDHQQPDQYNSINAVDAYEPLGVEMSSAPHFLSLNSLPPDDVSEKSPQSAEIPETKSCFPYQELTAEGHGLDTAHHYPRQSSTLEINHFQDITPRSMVKTAGQSLQIIQRQRIGNGETHIHREIVSTTPMSPQFPQRGQEAPEWPSSSTWRLSDPEFNSSVIDRQDRGQRSDDTRRENHASKKRTRDKVDTQTDHPSENKRPRKALQLKKKLEIIQYWEQNQHSPFQAIGRNFGVPRTTIYGIIKDRDNLQRLGTNTPHPGLALETTRMVERQFVVLEELLMAWVSDLRSRSIPVSGHKITTQAFEIHRMLSGQLVEPLPPCQFSSGWLKNFKKHRQISLTEMRNRSVDVGKAFEELYSQLQGFNMLSIYWCDMTNMFLGVIPKSVFQRGAEENQASTMDTASVSVLLCSNAFGDHGVKPLVLVRNGPGIFEIDGYNDMVVDAGVEDMTTSVFKDWLVSFGNMRAKLFKVALLVDEVVWGLLGINSCESTYTSGNVTVVKAPRELTSLMPMSAGIAKELKANYYILAMEARKAAAGQSGGVAKATSLAEPSNVAFEDYLKLIPEAWNRVLSFTLHHSFNKFVPPTEHLPDGRKDLSPDDREREKLKAMLKDTFPGIPNYIIRYYLNHDRDIGPSSFLRSKIQEMQRHSIFENIFGALGFGDVRVASKSPEFNAPNLRHRRNSSTHLTHMGSSRDGSDHMVVAFNRAKAFLTRY